MKRLFLFLQLISVLSPLSALAETSTNSVHPAKSKMVEIDGKQVSVKSYLIEESKLIELRIQEADAVAGTNGFLVHVPSGNLGPCGYDFAMSPGGKVLWVFLEETRELDGQHMFRIHPFIRNPNKTLEYVRYKSKRDSRHAPTDGSGAFDLSGMLRILAMSSFNKGKPLSLGREAHIADVQLFSTNATAVTVTGRIGTNYTFKGTVLLVENNDLVTKDFAIESGDDKP